MFAKAENPLVTSQNAVKSLVFFQVLGYDKYSVVGWSNGGLSAGFLAQTRPENVISIAICNAPLKPADRSNLVMDRKLTSKFAQPKYRLL